MAEEELAEQQVNLLQQIVRKLEDIRTVFEKIYVTGESKEDDFLWIDNADLIRLLKITSRTAQAWRDNGSLPFSQIGRRIYYNRRTVEKMLWDKFKTKVSL